MQTVVRSTFWFAVHVIILTLICVFPHTVLAIGLQAELTLSQPENGYFTEHDTLIATLQLRDNDGSLLSFNQLQQSNLRTLQLWIAGPRQDYQVVESYHNINIIDANGYHEVDGFNPDNGEFRIVMPEGLPASGTYTVLFKCQRVMGNVWYSAYPYADFQVEQLRRTRTNSLRYMMCSRCHENLQHHGAGDLAACVTCHAHDSDNPFGNLIHTFRHEGNRVTTCSDCHRAGADINKYSRSACFSCHSAPNNHRDYVDNQCINCHTGNRSVYSRHDEAQPRTPSAFDLLEPDNVVLDTLSVNLAWEEAIDNDNEDNIIYEIELCDNNQFINANFFDAGEDLTITIDDLVDDKTYWWRVKALDVNTEGRVSTQTMRFSTSVPEVPGNFSLVAPALGDIIDSEENFVSTLAWTASIEPDPLDELTYALTLSIRYDATMEDSLPYDTVLFYNDLTDTICILNLPDSLGKLFWDDMMRIDWTCTAISGNDVVEAENTSYYFHLQAHQNTVESAVIVPNEFSISTPYPNPFNSLVKFDISLPITDYVSVHLFDLAGRPIKNIYDGKLGVGVHNFAVNFRDYSSGVYLLRYNIGKMHGVKKLVLTH